MPVRRWQSRQLLQVAPTHGTDQPALVTEMMSRICGSHDGVDHALACVTTSIQHRGRLAGEGDPACFLRADVLAGTANEFVIPGPTDQGIAIAFATKLI